jgi:hypothetical protein
VGFLLVNERSPNISPTGKKPSPKESFDEGRKSERLNVRGIG